MAIYTLSTSANYSAIKGSLANGDTIRIDTNAVRLTINEQPLLTNITVDSPGVSGRVTVSGSYDLSTWSMVAGTVTLIDGTFPSGATLGSITGGSATIAHGISVNAGTVTTSTGGGGNQAFGINQNNGTATTANAGSVANAHGIQNNVGTVTTANGGAANTAYGVNTNNGTVTTANGGSGTTSLGVNINNGTIGTANGGSNATAAGVFTNNSTVTKANGGTNSTAHGVTNCFGICLEATDSTARGISVLQGGPKLINGPEFKTGTTNYVNVPRIYSIGQVSNLAAIPGAIPITILTEGSGGFSGIKGIDRNIGT
jgi:hypothetical protein